MKQFRLTNRGDEAELLIYAAVGEDDVTTAAVAKLLRDVRPRPATIHVRINSPGGYVSDGLGIYNILSNHPARIVTHVDGYALSAASVIFMAGDERVMAANSVLMIHGVSVGTYGTVREHEKSIEILRLLTNNTARTYASRTGLSEAEVTKMMEEETWMDAAQSVNLGFATHVGEPLKAAAHFDLAGRGYNPPAAVRAKLESLDVQERPMTPERYAELMAASGYRGATREADRIGGMSPERTRQLLRASGIRCPA